MDYLNSINKFGENTDIDTGSVPEVIWANGGEFPFLDSGIPMDIESSDPNDALLGTGARKVKIIYYTTANIKQEVEVELNGTSQVPIADDIKIITRASVSESGSGNINAGKLSMVDRATGTVVYQSIEIGEGQTLSAVQICPADTNGKIISHYATFSRVAVSFGAARLRLRLRKVDGTILTKYNITISSNHARDDQVYKKGGIDMLPGEIIFWECVAVQSNDTPIEAGFTIGLNK